MATYSAKQRKKNATVGSREDLLYRLIERYFTLLDTWDIEIAEHVPFEIAMAAQKEKEDIQQQAGELLMATYSAKQRKKNATVGDDGYPIGDKTHARLALDFIDKGGLSPAEKKTVRAKAARFGVHPADTSPRKKSVKKT